MRTIPVTLFCSKGSFAPHRMAISVPYECTALDVVNAAAVVRCHSSRLPVVVTVSDPGRQ